MKPLFNITSRSRRAQDGATLIEVLVSLVILMLGLLGLVGMMVQSQRSQLESYQRLQAMMLVQDMAARLNANRTAAGCYVLAGFVGTGNATTPDASGCGSGSATQKLRATQDLIQWQNLLLGSAEVIGTDRVGAVQGARGCVALDASGRYQISVAWQGVAATVAPAAGVTCGTGEYGTEAARRAVSLTVQI
jgi:type IV pilus assembly protein PilV